MGKSFLENKFLISGTVLLIIGAILMLNSLNMIPNLTVLWPVLFIMLGLIQTYSFFFGERRPSNIAFGIGFVLAGTLLVLQLTVLNNFGPQKTWPLYLMIISIAIYIYSRFKTGSLQLSLSLIGIFFFGLSLIFFGFSSGFLNLDFTNFVKTWWPSLIILLGIMLIVTHKIRK